MHHMGSKMKAVFSKIICMSLLALASQAAISQTNIVPAANYSIKFKQGISKEMEKTKIVELHAENELLRLSEAAKREGFSNYTIEISDVIYNHPNDPYTVLTIKAPELNLIYLLNSSILNKENLLAQIKTGLKHLARTMEGDKSALANRISIK